MDSRKFEINQDLDELHKLSNECTRPNVRTFLMGHRIKLEEDLKSLPVSESKESVNTEGLTFRAIDRFAWEQDDDNVKIYVTCFEGFKSHPKEKVSFESTNTSICVSIIDFKGVNYRLRFSPIHMNIKSARMTYKSNGFSVSMKKEESGIKWDRLGLTTTQLRKKKEEEDKTPSTRDDNLMRLMKNMYENGDDDMKKTISEAWEKARSGKVE